MNRMLYETRGSHILKRTAIYGIMTILAILAIVPIWLLIVNATRSTAQINSGLSLVPSNNALYNWRVLTKREFRISQGFVNSLFLASTTTLVTVYFSSMTAYGLHAYRFRGRRVIWSVILIIMMLPSSLSFIGFYQFVAKIHLLNSYIPLIVPAIASAGTVLFLRQYLMSIPTKDLIDQARIEGAGEFRIFNTIVLPVLSPAMATQAIFAFVGSWNNFFAPFIVISNAKKATLPMLIMMLQGEMYRTEFGGIYLGIAVSIVPILIVYAFISRYIISGIMMGGLKE
jgi:multiple sugar transport system permease protein